MLDNGPAQQAFGAFVVVSGAVSSGVAVGGVAGGASGVSGAGGAACVAVGAHGRVAGLSEGGAVSECCDHVLPLADCGCRWCHCATATQDVMDLDLPAPARPPIEPVDLDELLENR